MRVLIVGLGSIAKKHIAALRQLDSEIIIYALRSSVTSVEFEGVRNIYSFLELETITLDFAIVSNPTAEHKTTIEALLPLKCPLFIEKPLFHTLEVEEILEEIKESGMLTYVACNLRFLDCLQFVKKQLMGMRVNEVNVYCGSYLPEWREGVNWKDVYSANKEMGGGVHIDLIHEIDYLYWLFGMPNCAHKLFRNVSSLNITAFDYANYSLEYSDFTISVILNYYRKDARRTLEIVCDKETWEVDLRANRVMKNGVVCFVAEQNIVDTYSLQMGYFVGLVKENSTVSFNSFENALDVLKICLENVVRK